MTKSIIRMRLLFQDEEFKARLLELVKDGKLVAGASCPTGCDGALKATTLSYMSKDFEVQCVNVLRCECGFQFRRNEEDEKK